jgi:hypothetical protein
VARLETAQAYRAIEEIAFHKGLQAATLRPFCPLQIMIADHDYLRRLESTQKKDDPVALDTHHRSQSRG